MEQNNDPVQDQDDSNVESSSNEKNTLTMDNLDKLLKFILKPGQKLICSKEQVLQDLTEIIETMSPARKNVVLSVINTTENKQSVEKPRLDKIEVPSTAQRLNLHKKNTLTKNYLNSSLILKGRLRTDGRT